ncbi:hypothetical protein HMI54_009376 [Coelomomyces lativittatus]|nr:hypothetical protein HMI54_009376 [Coelomomyces lativittatus]
MDALILKKTSFKLLILLSHKKGYHEWGLMDTQSSKKGKNLLLEFIINNLSETMKIPAQTYISSLFRQEYIFMGEHLYRISFMGELIVKSKTNVTVAVTKI